MSQHLKKIMLSKNEKLWERSYMIHEVSNIDIDWAEVIA